MFREVQIETAFKLVANLPRQTNSCQTSGPLAGAVQDLAACLTTFGQRGILLITEDGRQKGDRRK
jgi:hypothetical protein